MNEVFEKHKAELGELDKVLRIGRQELDHHGEELNKFGIPLFIVFNTQAGQSI